MPWVKHREPLFSIKEMSNEQNNLGSSCYSKREPMQARLSCFKLILKCMYIFGWYVHVTFCSERARMDVCTYKADFPSSTLITREPNSIFFFPLWPSSLLLFYYVDPPYKHRVRG